MCVSVRLCPTIWVLNLRIYTASRCSIRRIVYIFRGSSFFSYDTIQGTTTTVSRELKIFTVYVKGIEFCNVHFYHPKYTQKLTSTTNLFFEVRWLLLQTLNSPAPTWPQIFYPQMIRKIIVFDSTRLFTRISWETWPSGVLVTTHWKTFSGGNFRLFSYKKIFLRIRVC